MSTEKKNIKLNFHFQGLDDLERFFESLGEFCFENKIDDKIKLEVQLSLEELVVNAFSHGYKSRSSEKGVDIVISIEDSNLKIVIEDEAPPFHLIRDSKEPVLSDKLEERPIGGLGIHLAKNLTDKIEYLRFKEGNRVTLFKSIK